MAEFCKITADGACEDAPNPLRITIANPSAERYRSEGFLEKKYTDVPAYDPETQTVTESWEQDGAFAVQKWTVCALSALNN